MEFKRAISRWNQIRGLPGHNYRDVDVRMLLVYFPRKSRWLLHAD